MISRKDLDDEITLIGGLDAFVEDGWNESVGFSRHNDSSRPDDLIARDIYEKTFECGMKYKIVADRMKVVTAKGLTSLPDINPEVDTDNTYYYRMTGVESIDGKVVSRVSDNVVSEFPYLDTLHMVVDTIATLEAGSKKIYRGKE